MDERDVRRRLHDRLAALNLAVHSDAVARAAAYLALLDRWNRRVNLTGFDLSEPGPEALDRLVVEPFAAAVQLSRSYDQTLLDIGSGGGSPALPFKLICPHLNCTWYEVRLKKAAFLREAVRTLGLKGVEVVARRFGGETMESGTADLITVRAVRLDPPLLRAVVDVMRVGSRLLIFGDSGTGLNLAPDLAAWTTRLWHGGPEVLVADRTVASCS